MARWRVFAYSLVVLFVPLHVARADEPRQAAFHVAHTFTVKVSPGAKDVRIWLAVPQEDAFSTVRNLAISSDPPVRYGEDSWGNRVGYVEVHPRGPGPIELREEFDLVRREERNRVDPAATRALSSAERGALQRYLLPATHVVVNDQVKKLAASIVGDETNPIRVARKLFDWTLQNVDYWVKDPDHLKASPVGSSDDCLRTKTGNCTDFHSLFASLAIASGLPNRMVYGSLLKPTLDGVAVDASYHCWIEFYAPGHGWLPLDVSLANIYGKPFPVTDKNRKLVELTTSTGYRGLDPAKADYYFGNLDERRVVWSVGRDLMLQPPQDDGPVNALSKAYVEIDGKQSTDFTRQLTYRELH